jgi:hypothetical protein
MTAAFIAWFLMSVSSWTPVASAIMAVLIAATALWLGRGIPAEALTLSLLFARDWRWIAALFVVYSLGAAVASEADRPRGLTVAQVTPSQDPAFEAVPLGQHSGRAVFLDLSNLRPEGVVELTPGSLKSVAVVRTGVYGPKDDRTFARRIVDWLSTRSWSIRKSGHVTRLGSPATT